MQPVPQATRQTDCDNLRAQCFITGSDINRAGISIRWVNMKFKYLLPKVNSTEFKDRP